jgi:hypothetical protein
VVNSFDPWHRFYNYPPVWLLARHLGITSHSSNLVGFLFAITAISAYVLLFNARTLLSGTLVFLAIASRCVLLSIERGNTDQVVFFLLVFGLFLINRLRLNLRSRMTGILLVLLTILKVYPIAAVTVLVQRRRGWKLAFATGMIALTALLLTSGPKLAFVIANTPRDPDMSFGSFPFLYSVSRHLLHSLTPVVVDQRVAAPLVGLLVSGICLLAGATSGSHLYRFLPPLDSGRTRGAIAIACLSIFCFAFVAGSSFDYRLIYLTGALAWLVEDIDNGNARRSLPAALLILVLLWKPFWLSITGELFDGLVFIMSATWLGNALFSQNSIYHRIPAVPTQSAAREQHLSLPPTSLK